MTTTELERRKAICDIAGVKEIDDVSDGFHTFRQLYYQRMILFATIVKQNKGNAWKSLRHEDGELCFGGGWFIVGVDTPEGSYTYHYEDNYFSLFDCEELTCGKHWDGHTEKDVTRLLSLPSAQPSYSCSHEKDAQPRNANLVERREWIPGYQNRWYRKIFSCSGCGTDIAMESWDEHRCFGKSTVLKNNMMPSFCPNCGVKYAEGEEDDCK